MQKLSLRFSTWQSCTSSLKAILSPSLVMSAMLCEATFFSQSSIDSAICAFVVSFVHEILKVAEANDCWVDRLKCSTKSACVPGRLNPIFFITVRLCRLAGKAPASNGDQQYTQRQNDGACEKYMRNNLQFWSRASTSNGAQGQNDGACEKDASFAILIPSSYSQ